MNRILKFNPASNEWEKTGEMSFARRYHALAVLPLEEVKPYCILIEWFNDYNNFDIEIRMIK